MTELVTYLGCMLEVADTIWAELICCMLCSAFSLWAASKYEWGPWPGTCETSISFYSNHADGVRTQNQGRVRKGQGFRVQV